MLFGYCGDGGGVDWIARPRAVLVPHRSPLPRSGRGDGCWLRRYCGDVGGWLLWEGVLPRLWGFELGCERMERIGVLRRLSTAVNTCPPCNDAMHKPPLRPAKETRCRGGFQTRPAQGMHERDGWRGPPLREVCTTSVIPAKAGIQREGQRGSTTDSRSKVSRQQLCTEPLRGAKRTRGRGCTKFNATSLNPLQFPLGHQGGGKIPAEGKSPGRENPPLRGAKGTRASEAPHAGDARKSTQHPNNTTPHHSHPSKSSPS